MALRRIVPALAGLLLVAPCVAYAQGEASEHTDVAAAARAFANGQAAELRDAHEEAAAFYELAFHLAPTPQALRSAVREWHRAGVRARAATLAEHLRQRYPDDPHSVAITRLVLGDAGEVLARYAISCEPACAIAIDGRAAELDRELSHVAYLEAGAHTIDVRWDDERSVRHEATVEPGSNLELSFAPPEVERASEPSAPPPAPSVPTPSVDPIAFVPFSVLAGATIALGGLTIASAVDAAIAAEDRNMSEADGVLEREMRTHVLLGLTCAAAAATAIVAALTDWDGPNVAPEISPTHASITVFGRLP
jgi:hypothetical protein